MNKEKTWGTESVTVQYASGFAAEIDCEVQLQVTLLPTCFTADCFPVFRRGSDRTLQIHICFIVLPSPEFSLVCSYIIAAMRAVVCVCSSRRYIETSRRRPTRGIFVGGDGGRSNICGPPRYAQRPLIIDGFGLFTRHFAHCIGYLFFSLTHAAKSPRTRTVALTHTHTHTSRINLQLSVGMKFGTLKMTDN